MKAVRIHAYGGPEQLRYEDIPAPVPGPGEAFVRHTAIGVNFADLHNREGRYPLPQLPHVLGGEAAGVVETLGPGVTGLRVGDRVAYAAGGPKFAPGSYAEGRVFPAERLIRIPDEIDDVSAAALFTKGLTAQYLIKSVYKVGPGDTILLHAAAGGVGLFLAQWANHLGARVIGVVSSKEKAELARANGCRHVIMANDPDIPGRVRALTGGEGVPVVYDSVGKDTFETSLDCLRPQAVERGLERVLADGIVDDRHALPARQRADAPGNVGIVRHDDVPAAVGAGEFRLLLRADDADHAGAEMVRPLGEEQPDAARRSVEQDRVARTDLVDALDEVLSGEALGEERRGRDVVDLVRDADQSLGREDASFGIGPRREFRAARGIGHAIADPEPRHARPERLHDARGLAAQNMRELREGIAPLPIVQIGEVHADGGMADEGLARSRNGSGNVLVAELLRPAVSMDADGFHDALCPQFMDAGR